MNRSEITLKNLFSLSAGGFPAGGLSVVESSPRMSSLKEDLLDKVEGLQWTSVRDELLNKIEDLLDVSLVDVMITAWKKCGILEKYSDREQYLPDETILVPLAEHTVKSEHHPYLDVLVNERSVGKIVFDVAVALTLKGFVLKIQDAKIKGIQTGSVQGKGTIALEKALLVEKAFDPIPLPGAIDLGEGVAIHGAVAAPLPAAKAEEQVEKRKDSRLEMKLPILIRGPRGEQEVTNTENLSKGGLAVPLAMNLAVGDILKIVCPYIPERQNTEEKAEVQRRVPLSLGDQELYGLRYLR